MAITRIAGGVPSLASVMKWPASVFQSVTMSARAGGEAAAAATAAVATRRRFRVFMVRISVGVNGGCERGFGACVQRFGAMAFSGFQRAA